MARPAHLGVRKKRTASGCALLFTLSNPLHTSDYRQLLLSLSFAHSSEGIRRMGVRRI